MIKRSDPRHIKRVKLLQNLFSHGFGIGNKAVKKGKMGNIVTAIETIDPLIEQAAPQFPVEKISKIDVAILRLAIFELLLEKKEPPKVIIDEAVELAKQFGNDNSSKFVNGVLGTILKSL